MTKVIVLGADGQLGTDLRKTSPAATDVIPITHQDLDLLDFPRVRELIAGQRPDAVINTAAYVDVDGAEAHRDQAFGINANAVRNLAETGVRLVQISTDYVFDGTLRRPYREDDAPNPINVYGASKLAGEEFARGHLIVRSSGLYGIAARRAKGNFVSTMLRLGRERTEVSVVDDQVLTPTSTADLAAAIWRLVERGARGLYHATNAGECSWFEFARSIFEMAGMEVKVKPIDTSTFGAKAPRPAYSVLDNAKLEHAGIERLRPWREALADHLAALARTS